MSRSKRAVDCYFTVRDANDKLIFNLIPKRKICIYVDTHYRDDGNKRKPTTLLKEAGYKVQVNIVNPVKAKK
jgi:hypothetical protein